MRAVLASLSVAAAALFPGAAAAQAQGPAVPAYAVVHGFALAPIGAASPRVEIAVPHDGGASVAVAVYAAAYGMAVDGRIPVLRPVAAVIAPDGDAVAVLHWHARGLRELVGRVVPFGDGFAVEPGMPPLLISCVVGRGCRTEPPLIAVAPVPVAQGAVAVAPDGDLVPVSSVVGDLVRADVLAPSPPRCRPARVCLGAAMPRSALWGWAVALEVLPGARPGPGPCPIPQDVRPVSVPCPVPPGVRPGPGPHPIPQGVRPASSVPPAPRPAVVAPRR